MKGPSLGPAWEDINWPDKVAPRDQKASSTREIKPQTSNLKYLVHDIWTTKEELATLLHPSTPEAREGDTQLGAFLTTRRHQLQEWHAHRLTAAVPGTRKIRQKPHAVQVPAVRQTLSGGQGTLYDPRGAHPQWGPHHRPRYRPQGCPGQLPGTTGGHSPRARPPYQKHHPRTWEQPGTAARHWTRPLQHPRTSPRPRPPKKGGRARSRRSNGRSVPTPHPARQAPPGCPSVSS